MLKKFELVFFNAHSFVETNMSKEQIEDAVTGLSFYLEDETKYGNELALDIEFVVGFLHKCYDSIISTSDGFTTDENRSNVIDLYSARESRCGSDSDKYVENIKEKLNEEYVQTIVECFNNDLWNGNTFSGGKGFEKLISDLKSKFSWFNEICVEER